ncbi:MAG: GNAT family N-acetyltransferase [Candidatus Cloacimonetes bacterium]|nr:GNAT family N-acetyltransferase [Candidatus Cloacimonadota bacterium]
MNDLDLIEFDNLVSKEVIRNKIIQVFTSFERTKENPYNVRFPIIFKERNNEILVSIHPDFDINKLELVFKKIAQQNLYFPDIIYTFASNFNFKILEVNRYYSKCQKKVNKTNYNFFPKVSQSEIEFLNANSSVSLSNIAFLNNNNKIYIHKIKNVIKGYGLVTRENEEFVEISITTLKKHRDQGVGFKIVDSMTKLINQKGKTVVYLTETQNISSNKIALKCGYDFIGKEFIVFDKVKGEKSEE